MRSRKSLFKVMATIFILFVCIVVNSKPTEAAAASSLRIENASLPTNIAKGNPFDCKGVIKSNYNIVSVTGRILKSDGKTVVYTKTVQPNKTSYSLYGSSIDLNLFFNKLGEGAYYYQIWGKDSSGKNLCLVNQRFTVGNLQSTLRIESASKPTSITKGNAFDCKGVIKSNYNITYVTGRILKSDGKTVVYTKTVQPNNMSYSLYGSSIDVSLFFNKLTEGTYYYQIWGSDTSGKCICLINQPFSVVSVKPNVNVGGVKAIKLSPCMGKYSLSQQSYKYFVRNGINYGCCATAYATGLSIINKKAYNPTETYDWKRYCYFKWGGINSQTDTRYSTIYDQLKKGKPTLVHYKYNKNNEHWVLVIGVKANTNANRISDFYIIDPANGKTTTLDKAQGIKNKTWWKMVCYK